MGDSCLGFSRRRKAYSKFRAVTTAPFENRKPRRIVNVYVLPSRETRGHLSASSGTIRYPAGGDLSGYRIRRAQVRLCTAHDPVRKERAGSIASNSRTL